MKFLVMKVSRPKASVCFLPRWILTLMLLGLAGLSFFGQAMSAFGQASTSVRDRFENALEASRHYWPEGEMHLSMWTNLGFYDLKLWWIGDRVRRQYEPAGEHFLPFRQLEGVEISGPTTRTTYLAKHRVVTIASLRSRPTAMLGFRGLPSEGWVESRYTVPWTRWWREVNERFEPTVEETTDGGFTVHVPLRNGASSDCVFNRFGLIISCSVENPDPAVATTRMRAEWRERPGGPPDPVFYIIEHRLPGEKKFQVYQRMEVHQFMPQLSADHPDLTIPDQAWPVGTQVNDRASGRGTYYIGGEEGKRQAMMWHSSLDLSDDSADRNDR